MRGVLIGVCLMLVACGGAKQTPDARSPERAPASATAPVEEDRGGLMAQPDWAAPPPGMPQEAAESGAKPEQ